MKAKLFPRLDRLARNLWWTWQPDAHHLFASMDPPLWHATNHNPLKTMRMLAPERRDAIANDEDFNNRLGRCERELDGYLKSRTWFDRNAKARDRDLLVAYFCAEYAVHESLPQYAGGLGVLA